VLTREHWSSASLREIIGDAVAPFGGQNRFTIDGPQLRLDPRTAVSFALAMHELATNAVKYGALQGENGRVSVTWSIQSECLCLTWSETGGPRVASPSTRGFGTRLIERGLARELGGTVTLAFEPSGVVCSITAPLPAGGPPHSQQG
jgi:two-component sensor histidine kinase